MVEGDFQGDLLGVTMWPSTIKEGPHWSLTCNQLGQVNKFPAPYLLNESGLHWGNALREGPLLSCGNSGTLHTGGNGAPLLVTVGWGA